MSGEEAAEVLRWIASKLPGSRRKEQEKNDVIGRSKAAIRRFEDLDERAQKLIEENTIDSVFARENREGRRHADY